MTDTSSPHPGPHELPTFDAWWDGVQWRRIGDPASSVPLGSTARDSTHVLPVQRPSDATPSQDHRFFPDQHVTYQAILDHTTGALLDPPRRSRLNASMWAVAIAGSVFLALSLANATAQVGNPSSHRAFVDIPVVEPAGAAGALPLDEAEEFVAAFEPHKDSHGTYIQSGLAITRAFGAELRWTDWNSPEATTNCTQPSDGPHQALAWYCGREPYLIHLNSTATTMPAWIYDPRFMDTVRHELAHLVIFQRCGNTEPATGTVEEEGVTNSYAVLYLGADRAALDWATADEAAYAMTSQTDEAAVWIHSGVCW